MSIEAELIRAGTDERGELVVEVQGDPDTNTIADLSGAIIAELMERVETPAEAMALAGRLMQAMNPAETSGAMAAMERLGLSGSPGAPLPTYPGP